MRAGVHRFSQQGISWSRVGADAIVLSGGYVDDEDLGYEIIYTGEGGRDQSTGRQVSDQQMVRGNAALSESHRLGLPVRVVRGATHRSEFSPSVGYQYGGTYRVDEVWHEASVDGPLIYRYRLSRLADGDRWSPIESELERMLAQAELGQTEPARRDALVSRVIRDSAISHAVKLMYEGRCQICRTTVETPAGPYSEGAHIRPLGRPHNGRDSLPNILCLCPNDHVGFDRGALFLDETLTVRDGSGHARGALDRRDTHNVDLASVSYHRDHIFRSLSSGVASDRV